VVPPLGGIARGLDTPTNVAPARRLDAALAAAAILRATSAALGAAASAGTTAAAEAVAAIEEVASALGAAPATEVAPPTEVTVVAPTMEVAPALGAAGVGADAVVEPPVVARFVLIVVELASAPALGTFLTVFDRALAPTPAVGGERVFA
jgi:hypothetical protein